MDGDSMRFLQNPFSRRMLVCMIMLTVSISTLYASTDDEQRFRAEAVAVQASKPWERSALNPHENESLIRLKHVATQIMLNKDALPTMLSLINQYRDQDGIARAELVKAVLYAPRDYTAADLPFLASMLRVATTFRWEAPPSRKENREDDFAVKIALGDMILAAAGRGDLVVAGKQERALLVKDPEAWLAKYAH